MVITDKLSSHRPALEGQRFLEPFGTICNHFRTQQHRLAASAYRQLMDERRQTWRNVTAIPAAQ